MRIEANFRSKKYRLVRANDRILHPHLSYLLHLALTRSLHNFLNLAKHILLAWEESNALRDLICINTKRILSLDREV